MLDTVKNAYLNIDFVNRYKKLSFSHSHKNSLAKANKEEILTTLKQLGYVRCKYHSKDKFYEVEGYEQNEIAKNTYAGLNIIVRYNEIDFVLSIVINGIGQNGGPYGVVCNKLGIQEMIRRPEFIDLEEMQNIFKEGLSIYEDIKKALISLNK